VCILFGPKESARLKALAEHTDGFRLAEIDLELRREGELVGTLQSGYGEFAVARLPEDEPLLERARAVAAELLADDPDLVAPEHALLADWLRERFEPGVLDLPIPA
jgi:ATP-dependent DNA helicase RecG